MPLHGTLHGSMQIHPGCTWLCQVRRDVGLPGLIVGRQPVEGRLTLHLPTDTIVLTRTYTIQHSQPYTVSRPMTGVASASHAGHAGPSNCSKRVFPQSAWLRQLRIQIKLPGSFAGYEPFVHQRRRIRLLCSNDCTMSLSTMAHQPYWAVATLANRTSTSVLQMDFLRPLTQHQHCRSTFSKQTQLHTYSCKDSQNSTSHGHRRGSDDRDSCCKLASSQYQLPCYRAPAAGEAPSGRTATGYGLSRGTCSRCISFE